VLSNKKGIVLVIVIGTVFLLLGLILAMFMLSIGHHGFSTNNVQRSEAYYAAEAAMQHVLYQFRVGDPSPGTLPAEFDVNGYTGVDEIVVSPVPVGTEPEGCQRIDITVSY